jgi:hypothetical protein
MQIPSSTPDADTEISDGSLGGVLFRGDGNDMIQKSSERVKI